MTFPLLSLTLAVFLCPEFGFFGFVIPTFRHTPFISGRPTMAGERERRSLFTSRPLRRTWFSVVRCGVVADKEREVGTGWGGRRIGRRKVMLGR
ncbi:hypothetical protein GJ744_001629 [Endocarpon pusillum]|uniref:Uncharacterized protein n=1 Tax=Endocarpon pusillum TaxID=364733 RepID=A0A8H7A9Z3_9EURO|nr:hypothetical protein GJ744_001629 [Endocarpon pusillum]